MAEKKEKPFILVCNNGFVLIGRVKDDPNEYLFWKLSDCGVIRRWGTSAGLGQLAFDGIQTETIIDPEPDDTTVLKTDVKRKIPCLSAKWDEWTTRKT